LGLLFRNYFRKTLRFTKFYENGAAGFSLELPTALSRPRR